MTRPWELRRAVRAVCDLHGIHVAFEQTNGGHQRAVLTHPRTGVRRVVVYASTPSDWRALHNLMSRLRYTIREIDRGGVPQGLTVPIIRRAGA